MKKNDVVREIAARLRLPRAECSRVIDVFADVVTDALVNGEKVVIRGFVTFEPSEYKERHGYNPFTGEMENFDTVRTVRCKIGEPIKKAVNER